MSNSLISKFKGCIIGGAIGDAFGSGYENLGKNDDDDVFYLFDKPQKKKPEWQITDDTQFSLITCNYLSDNDKIDVAELARYFLSAYKAKKLRGLGSSTLKALRELEFGGHWSIVGRQGEYAAGNGAAMRIAPLSFREEIDKKMIRDICSITHRNDEAYVGALCVVISIREIIKGNWKGEKDLRELIIDQIPDTRVRDRLIQDSQNNLSIEEIGELGNNGYVVNSIPLAISAANEVARIGFESMCEKLIEIGGDTDTNCSIAGQIAGTLIGYENIPIGMKEKLESLSEYGWIEKIIDKFIEDRNWA